MDILFSRIFWGAFVIIAGLLIILGAVFKINLPFFRIMFSLLLIYIGLKMLFGAFYHKSIIGRSEEGSSIFSEGKFEVTNGQIYDKYNVIFGNQIVDLRQLQLEKDREIKFNTIFGGQTVILPKNQNVRLKANAIFGSAKLPDDNQISFGEKTFAHKNQEDAGYSLFIEGNVVFGELKFLWEPD